MVSLRSRHMILLMMIAVLSPNFIIAEQKRSGKDEKPLLPPHGCVVTAPKKALPDKAKPDKTETAASDLAAPGCALLPGSNPEPHEGSTDYTTYVRPEGVVKSVMIFVDFPDAKRNETTSSLYDLLVPPYSLQWLNTASYGQFSIAVTPVHKWFRMPKKSTTYKMTGDVTYVVHKAYIADAIAAADKDVDFTQYKSIYIVASQDAKIDSALTFAVPPTFGFGVWADGVEQCSVVTFGSYIRLNRPNYGSHVFIHETGHTFGLPDLYASKHTGFFDQFRYLGAWSIMSWDEPGAMFNAWELQKLGWLKPDQIHCLGAGQYEETLAALEESGGLKALTIKTGPSTACVIEVRQPAPTNLDSNLCDRGVLVYTVDAGVESGGGPIVAKPARAGTDPSQIDKCGPFYDATLNLDSGGVPDKDYPNLKLKVEVLSAVGNGYKVRVTNSN